MSKAYFLIILSILIFGDLHAQISDKVILKHMKAKAIEWILDSESQDLARVKMKSTNKWGVYSISIYEYTEDVQIDFAEVVAPKFDSIGWFKDLEPFTIVKNDGKYGILLNPYEVGDAANKVELKYDAIQLKESSGRYYALVKRGSKWGLIDWFDGFYLVDPSFDKPEDVPLVWVESWAADMFKKSKKKLEADILIFDEGNGDGVFKARNRKTKKWGMYQSWEPGQVTTLIPAEYDSLRFFPFNGTYTAVFNNGKIGFYLAYWSFEGDAKQTVKCLYEDYKRYNADGVPKLAVKKNGKWGWVDWLTGEEKSEFIYETRDDLPYPYYEQKTWVE